MEISSKLTVIVPSLPSRVISEKDLVALFTIIYGPKAIFIDRTKFTRDPLFVDYQQKTRYSSHDKVIALRNSLFRKAYRLVFHKDYISKKKHISKK